MSKKVAASLKKLRELEALTQKDLADHLSIDRSKLSKYERGLALPSIDTLIEIATFFNVSVDYLVKDSSPITKEGDVSIREREIMSDYIIGLQKIEELESAVEKLKDSIKHQTTIHQSLLKYIQHLEQQ